MNATDNDAHRHDAALVLRSHCWRDEMKKLLMPSECVECNLMSLTYFASRALGRLFRWMHWFTFGPCGVWGEYKERPGGEESRPSKMEESRLDYSVELRCWFALTRIVYPRLLSMVWVLLIWYDTQYIIILEMERFITGSHWQLLV